MINSNNFNRMLYSHPDSSQLTPNISNSISIFSILRQLMRSVKYLNRGKMLEGTLSLSTRIYLSRRCLLKSQLIPTTSSFWKSKCKLEILLSPTFVLWPSVKLWIVTTCNLVIWDQEISRVSMLANFYNNNLLWKSLQSLRKILKLNLWLNFKKGIKIKPNKSLQKILQNLNKWSGNIA